MSETYEAIETHEDGANYDPEAFEILEPFENHKAFKTHKKKKTSIILKAFETSHVPVIMGNFWGIGGCQDS